MNIQLKSYNSVQIRGNAFQKQTQKEQYVKPKNIISANTLNQNQNNQVKGIYKQIEKLKNTIENLKNNDKIPVKEKLDQLKEMQKQMQDLQKQLVEVTQQEKEDKVKEQVAKKDEASVQLTPEERKQKIQVAQQKMLSGIATAAINVQQAEKMYHKVKAYTTKGEMGIGPKYNGNDSLAEVQSHFSKAASYGRKMMHQLKEARQDMALSQKAAQEYQKHSKKEINEEIKNEEHKIIE